MDPPKDQGGPSKGSWWTLQWVGVDPPEGRGGPIKGSGCTHERVGVAPLKDRDTSSKRLGSLNNEENEGNRGSDECLFPCKLAFSTVPFFNLPDITGSYKPLDKECDTEEEKYGGNVPLN